MSTTGRTYYYTEGGSPQWEFPDAPATSVSSSASYTAATEPVVKRAAQPTTSSSIDTSSHTVISSPYEHRATKFFATIAFFEHSGTVGLILYWIFYVLFALYKLLVGILTVNTAKRQFIDSLNADFTPKPYRLTQVIMIVDGALTIVDPILRFIVQRKSAKHILSNPPSFKAVSVNPIANANVFFSSTPSLKSTYLVGVIVWGLVKIFQFIMTIIVTLDLGGTTYIVCLLSAPDVSSRTLAKGEAAEHYLKTFRKPPVYFFGNVYIILNSLVFGAIFCFFFSLASAKKRV